MLHANYLRVPVRSLMLRIGALLTTLLITLWPLAAHAATINVDGTTCTLPEAIEAANTDSAFDGCTAGSGPDILLLGGLTHSLTTGPFDPDGDGLTATPNVTTTIIISGGVGGSTVQRTGAAHYRLFHVGSTGDLTLQNVAIRNGYTDNSGGAINSRGGRLTLIGSHIISNTAESSGGGIHSNNTSTLTLNDVDIISNTAEYGAGIANYQDSHAGLDDVRLHANHAKNDGGGVYNWENSVMTITNSSILSNTAADEAGGLINEDDSTLTLTNSDVISNTSDHYTAGIGNYSDSYATLNNVRVHANHTSGDGSGIYNWDGSVMTITNSSILSNTAAEGFGGIINEDNSTLNLTNSDVIANTSVDNTGGIGNYHDSHATLDSVRVYANHASNSGGGVYNYNSSVMTITNSSILSNTAVQGGGGIVNDHHSNLSVSNSLLISNSAGANGGGLSNIVSSTVTLDGVQIRANHAISMGGGIYNSAVITGTGSKLIDNRAVISGSALYQAAGQTKVNQSCIFNNTDTAVVYGGGNDIDATDNWWGAPDGPGPIGPGQGDSLSANVTYNPFLTSTILGCSSRSIALAFTKHVSPVGELKVGQPVTYTLMLTHTLTDIDPRTAKNIYVSDPIPTGIEVSSVITTPGTSFNGSSYVISALGISETASIIMVGQVSPQLSQAVTVTNTAILTHAQSSPITATVANSVTLTLVQFDGLPWEVEFRLDEILITGKVLLLEPSDYVDVTAQIFYSPTFISAISTLPQATAAEVMTVTFPIGSTSQDIELSIPTAGGKPSAVEVSLQSPVGAMLGDERDAVITLIQKSYFPSLHR